MFWHMQRGASTTISSQCMHELSPTGVTGAFSINFLWWALDDVPPWKIFGAHFHGETPPPPRIMFCRRRRRVSDEFARLQWFCRASSFILIKLLAGHAVRYGERRLRQCSAACFQPLRQIVGASTRSISLNQSRWHIQRVRPVIFLEISWAV